MPPNHALQRTGRAASPSCTPRLLSPYLSLSLEASGDHQMQVVPRLLLLVWLPVFLVVSSLGLLVQWGSGNFLLAYHHTQTQGVSLGPSPLEHGNSIYRFQVGSRSYRAAGSQGHGYIPEGQTVTVYYVAADPRLSSLIDPLTYLYGNLRNVFTGAATMATMGLGLGLLVSVQRPPA